MIDSNTNFNDGFTLLVDKKLYELNVYYIILKKYFS